MCVEDNETKKLILSVHLLPVTGRSFVQPEASSSLLANAETKRVNFCVSSKQDLPQVDLCLNSFGYSSPALERSVRVRVAIFQPTVREQFLESLARRESGDEPNEAASHPIRSSRYVDQQTLMHLSNTHHPS